MNQFVGPYSKKHYAPGNIVDGQKIRFLREKKGWSLEIMARQADMTIENLERIEKGDGNTSTGKLRAMAHALDVNPAALVVGIDELVSDALAGVKKPPEKPTYISNANRDITLLRAFAGPDPAFLQIGSLKSDVPEEILGDILHVIAVHRLKTGS